FAIDIGSGFVIAPAKRGSWVVEPLREDDSISGRRSVWSTPEEEAFDPNHIIGDAVGRSFAYAQHNALELARIGQSIVAGVGRVIFAFGITLMLAAYVIITRERILGFFASLVRPAGRASFARLVARVDRGLSGVVRGQLIICLVNGVLSAVGFAIV